MITYRLDRRQREMRDAVLQHLVRQRTVERLRQRDASLWYPAPETQARIRERLGWLDLPTATEVEAVLALLQAAVEQQHPEKIVYVAPGTVGRAVQLWRSLLGQPSEASRIVVLDTADPATVQDVLSQCDPERSLVVHAGSFETPQAGALAAVLPPDLVVPLPRAVGDRFGAFTGAALAPAVFGGDHWRPIVDTVSDTTTSFFADGSFADNHILQLASTLGSLAQAGHDLIDIVAPRTLIPLARWLEVLVAGALSKHRRGFVPLITTPAAHAAHHQLIVQLVPDQPEHALDRSWSDVVPANVPIIHCAIRDHSDIAAQVMTWQLAVSVAAMVLGVNPFDVPDADVINARIVNQGIGIREQPTQGGAAISSITEHDVSMPVLHSLLTGARFLAVAAFFPDTYDDGLQALCDQITVAFKVPTVLVYPLRDAAFSLQLLHAGRPGGAVLVLSTEQEQIVDQRIAPLLALHRTQLAVELETWRRMGQPHVHLALGSDIAAELKQLLSRVSPSSQHNH